MAWQFARAEHSIERAAATIIFRNPLEPNKFDEILVAGRKAAEALLMTRRFDFPQPFPLALPPGGMIEFGAARRVSFQRHETGGAVVEEFTLMPNELAFTTFQYRRWRNFSEMISEIIEALEKVCPLTTQVRAVRLEYVDQFKSDNDTDDHFEVINQSSQFIPPITASKAHALHAHTGWFDFETSTLRKLTNVNIDVFDAPLPPSDDRSRKITVVSLSQMEALDGSLSNFLDELYKLHNYLKMVFKDTVTPNIANRVGLAG